MSLYGALDSHPVFPSHVASGRCVLSAAAAGAPAGVVSAFAEPSRWGVGAVLNVAGCAVCASAAPNSWRIGSCVGCCRGSFDCVCCPHTSVPPPPPRPEWSLDRRQYNYAPVRLYVPQDFEGAKAQEIPNPRDRAGHPGHTGGPNGITETGASECHVGRPCLNAPEAHHGRWRGPRMASHPGGQAPTHVPLAAGALAGGREWGSEGAWPGGR